MDEKIIEEYKTLEEATNRARELNGVIRLDSGLSAGTYDYCVKIHRNNGKRSYFVVKTVEAVKEKKLKKAEVKGRINEILKMRERKLSYDKIAEEIGTHVSVVYELHQKAMTELQGEENGKN